MIDTSVFFIEQWDSKQRVDFAQAVTEIRVSYDIAGCSQLTVRLVDENFRMWNANYFQIGTTFIFKNARFRLASTEIQQGEGFHYVVTLELREEAVQKMKEDRKPQAFKSSTGFDFAQKVAAQFGLEPVIQRVSGVKQAAIKVKSTNNRESVWDVLQRAAQDIQFLCFVANGKLFFVSPYYLLGRWGIDQVQGATFETRDGKTELRTLNYIPLIYPSDISYRFFLLSLPNMRRSEDSPKESEGSASLWGGEGYGDAQGTVFDMRAGMTVFVYGIHGFEQAYIITSIEYMYGLPEPVEIKFATVSKLAPADKDKVKGKISEEVVISGTGG